MKRTPARDAIVIVLLSLMVGLEAWYVLSRNPVAIANAPQGPAAAQGKDGLPQIERDGVTAPGEPPNVSLGEGNPNAKWFNTIDVGPTMATAHDDYHTLLLGIILLEEEPGQQITRQQARALLQSMEARAGVAEKMMAAAMKNIIEILSAEQRDVIDSTQAQRLQQGIPPLGPQQLSQEVQQLQRQLEAR